MSDRTFWGEFWWQVGSQIGHFFWAFGLYALPATMAWLGTVPFILGLMGTGAGTFHIIQREVRQAKDGSHVWWDPYLDASFFVLGALAGFFFGSWLRLDILIQ